MGYFVQKERQRVFRKTLAVFLIAEDSVEEFLFIQRRLPTAMAADRFDAAGVFQI